MKGPVKNVNNPTCACTPKWMKGYLEDGKANACCHCHIPYEPTEINMGGMVMFPCGHTPGRVHCTLLTCHQLCISAWRKEFDSGIKAQLCEFVPVIPDHAEGNDELLRLFRDKCLATHKPIMIICAGCGLQAQEHYRFKACSGCHNVRYCTVECQHAHWQQHKQSCEPPSKGPVERDPVDETRRCMCFTAHETTLFERSFSNLCSNAPCERIVKGPVQFSMFVTQCTAYDKALPHMIATKYCSQKCQSACTSK
jgi:hypothetical protein